MQPYSQCKKREGKFCNIHETYIEKYGKMSRCYDKKAPSQSGGENR
jgi:hypothetical protein